MLIERCTICGVRVIDGGRRHLAGGTFEWAADPVDHPATLDPRFLLVWLTFAASWRAHVAADAG